MYVYLYVLLGAYPKIPSWYEKAICFKLFTEFVGMKV